MAEDGGEVLDSWEELDDKDVSLSIQTYRITVKEKNIFFNIMICLDRSFGSAKYFL